MPIVIPALGVPSYFYTVAIESFEYPTIMIVKCNALLCNFIHDYFAGTEYKVASVFSREELGLLGVMSHELPEGCLENYAKAPVLIARNDEVAKAYCDLLVKSPEFIHMTGVVVTVPQGQTSTEEYDRLSEYFSFK